MRGGTELSKLRSNDEQMQLTRRALVSIVVPTRNEAPNLWPFVSRVSAALGDFTDSWEIIFVDDSDDSTSDVIASMEQAGRPVRMVHREPGRRAGGLSGAVIEGFATSDSPVLVVMGADLQHPPELLPHLVEPIFSGDADVAVATRSSGDVTAGGLDGVGRRVISSGNRRVVQLLVPPVDSASDPLDGFFALRFDGVSLDPDGFKTLLEILTRGNPPRVDEVPVPEPVAEAPRRLSGVGRAMTSAPVRIVLAAALIVAAYWYSLGSLVSAWDPADPRTVACAVPFIAALLLLACARPAPDEPSIHDRQVDYLLGFSALAVATFMLVMLPRRMDVAFWVERLDVVSLPIFVAGLVAVLFGTRAMWRVRWALLVAVLAWPAITRAIAGRIAEPLGSTSLAATRTLSDGFGLSRVTLSTSSTATMVLFAVIAGAALLIWLRPRPALGLAWLVSLALGAWGANVVRLTAAQAAGASRHTAASRVILGSVGFFVTAGLTVIVAGWFLVARRDREPVSQRVVVERRSPAVLRPGLAIGLVSLIAVGTGIVTSGYGRYEAVVGPLGTAKVLPLGTRPLSVPGYVVVDRHSTRKAAPEPRRFEVRHVGAEPGAAPIILDAFAVTDPGDSAVSSLRAAYPLGGAVLVSTRSVALGNGRRGELVTFRRQGRPWTALSWVWPVRGGSQESYERIVISGRELQSATATVTAPNVDAVGPDAGDAPALRRFAAGVVRAELGGTSSDFGRADGER